MERGRLGSRHRLAQGARRRRRARPALRPPQHPVAPQRAPSRRAIRGFRQPRRRRRRRRPALVPGAVDGDRDGRGRGCLEGRRVEAGRRGPARGRPQRQARVPGAGGRLRQRREFRRVRRRDRRGRVHVHGGGALGRAGAGGARPRAPSDGSFRVGPEYGVTEAADQGARADARAEHGVGARGVLERDDARAASDIRLRGQRHDQPEQGLLDRVRVHPVRQVRRRQAQQPANPDAAREDRASRHPRRRLWQPRG
mmetsp:Transcript_7219/g.29281  ORF Transcript_7219/g.29281 Transcript_7219/m.29281 type:complete len:254 (+) Transcript_7219:478-1239(+)